MFRADGLGSNTRLVVDYKYGPMMQPDLLILSGGRATERPARPRMAGLPWGEVSKWVALLTLTLSGVMDYRGMLSSPHNHERHDPE